MFGINKAKQVLHKDIIKRINYQLKNNFFSIHEFSELSFRKAYKVIQLISKINNIKLRRTELKTITKELQTIALTKTSSKIKIKIIAPLFNWTVTVTTEVKEKVFLFFQYITSFIFIFRLDRKKVLRI